MRDPRVRANVTAHDRVARRYERRHGEIFNPIEQSRLHDRLAIAVRSLRTGTAQPRALDFGCGSGNVTAHLISMGIHTTAADVSQRSLDLVAERHGSTGLCETAKIEDGLSRFPDGVFDLVATYSVLHHLPDYLAALRDLARVLRPGGVLFIDHEASSELWSPKPEYREWLRSKRRIPWYVDQLVTMSLNWPLYRVRRLFDPRATEEGDIHVWPDDHVEWSAVLALLEGLSFEMVLSEDYLLYRRHFDPAKYEVYRERCSDTHVIIARRKERADQESKRS